MWLPGRALEPQEKQVACPHQGQRQGGVIFITVPRAHPRELALPALIQSLLLVLLRSCSPVRSFYGLETLPR
jgi:hypothetical protein